MATDKSVNLKLLEVSQKFADALAEINAKLDKLLAAMPDSKLEQVAKSVERKARQ